MGGARSGQPLYHLGDFPPSLKSFQNLQKCILKWSASSLSVLARGHMPSPSQTLSCLVCETALGGRNPHFTDEEMRLSQARGQLHTDLRWMEPEPES